MSEDFMRAVEEGLKLSKRLYFGKDRSVAPPKPPPPMSKSPQSYVPTAPMVYAVIHNPAIVDNPDIPSYQPHVYGSCDPPALIPLQMNGVELEVECFFDSVFVRVSGSWRVHCVMASKCCDCRIAVPLGEQGSILGVEVEVPRKSYSTQLVSVKEGLEVGFASGADGGYLKPGLFMITIPCVDGGTNLLIKLSWSQKVLYYNGDSIISVPFSFPEFVLPAGRKVPKKEKILLSINSGEGFEVVCKTTSHPLKERRCEVGTLSFSYEADVLKWSSMDFSFSYAVTASNISGHVLLHSPSFDDVDQREMFYVHVVPGNQHNKKVFARRIIYVVDTSGSMLVKPLEDIKNALLATLSELNPADSFNILAFNEGTSIFSSSLKHATKEVIEDVLQWIGVNFVAGGGTNILVALNQALEMLSGSGDSIPMIFLITDGAVEDERHICDMAEKHLSNTASIGPRIHTFGIGQFCNHYFLRKLSIIGRGHYGAAFDTDSIELQLPKLFNRASSAVYASIVINSMDQPNEIEVYPTHIPDLLSEGPLIVCGRYRGNFPEVLELSGIAADMKNLTIELRVQKSKDTWFQKSKDISLQRIMTTQQISMWTAQAWFSEDKQLEEKIARISVMAGVVSEYTVMVLVESRSLSHGGSTVGKEKMVSSKSDLLKEGSKSERKLLLNLGLGFGNVKATAENLPPGSEEVKAPEAAEIIIQAASNLCGKLCGYCCCMCCIRVCSKLNDQCVIVLTQACTAFACFGCVECCLNVCCKGSEGN
ncbi:hypothetical protein Dimus_025857 [Dionaea muscipula]